MATDRMTIGNVEIVALLDMVPPPYDPQVFFPDVPPEAWEPYGSDHLDDGNLQLYYVCFALHVQGKVMLLDTGMGSGPHPSRGNRRGDLLNQLKVHGIEAEDVETVVHTHLHHDHVGWNITWEAGHPKATFPRARYLVPRKDWEHFTIPSVLETAPHVRDSVVPLEDLGVLDLIDEEYTVNSEVTTVPTPGHTPGHVNILITSQGEKAVVVGDVFHSKVQIQEPGWCCRADLDKDLGLRSRKTMLDRIEREDMVVAAGHFRPDEHFGRVVRIQGRRYWQVI